MDGLTWGSIVSSLVAAAIFALVGWLAPKLWLHFSTRVRPWIWGLGFGFVRRFYADSFVDGVKRKSEIRSRIRSSKAGIFIVVSLVLLFVMLFVLIINAAVYYETILDVAMLLDSLSISDEEFVSEVDRIFENAKELEPFIDLIDSQYTFYGILGAFCIMLIFGAISHIRQEFNASLEVELKRLNEYMKILASKQELKDLAILECNVNDSPTAGAYIAKVNEIARRHGLESFDNLFPIVSFLRRLDETSVVDGSNNTDDSPAE